MMDWKDYWESEGGPFYYDNESYYSGYRLDSLKVALEICSTIEFSTVLDVGVGFGFLTKPLMENFPAAAVTGIDIAKSQIETAEDYLKGLGAHLRVIDFMDMEEGKWDLVYCWSVLLHIHPQMIKNFVEKMFRVSNQYVLVIDAQWSISALEDRNNRTKIIDQWSHDLRSMAPSEYEEIHYEEIRISDKVVQPIILWRKEKGERINDS